MEWFYLTAGAATLITLAVVTWYLWRDNQISSSLQDNNAINVRLVKEQLAELEADFEQGQISAADYQYVKEEIKLALVQEQNKALLQVAAPQKFLALPLLLIVLLTGWIYSQAQQLDKVQTVQTASAKLTALSDKFFGNQRQQAQISAQDVQDFALAIRANLRQDESDVMGWYLLGQLNSQLGLFDEAFAAFDKALAMDENNTMFLSAYAQALLLPNRVDYFQRAEGILLRLLALAPDDVGTKLSLALVYTQLEVIDKAEQYVTQITPLIPANNQALAQINQRLQILKAQQTTLANVYVSLQPDLLPVLGERRFPWLFIAVRQGTGGPPLLAKKIPFTGFPVQVNLTAADFIRAQQGQPELTGAILTARLSLDENALPQAGELAGQIQLTEQVLAAAVINLEINQEVN